jgi:hypothetical protein
LIQVFRREFAAPTARGSRELNGVGHEIDSDSIFHMCIIRRFSS